jgi:hypothetical protein
MFMRGVIINEDVNRRLFGHSGFNDVEEADELLMAMTLHTLADDLTFEHVKGSEQGCGALPFVVMRQGCGAPLLHWMGRLSASERLDLAFSSTDNMTAWSGGLT